MLVSDFVERFRRQFLADFLVHWQHVLSFEDGAEPAYLGLRGVPLIAVADGLDAGVDALRQAIGSSRRAADLDRSAAGPLDLSRNVVETALGLCNLALVEPGRPTRTRPIVDLMLDLNDLGLRSLALAFAAVIHARAGDDRLASIRFQEALSTVQGGALSGGVLDSQLTHYLLVYASRLAGALPDVVPPPVLTNDGRSQAIVWEWLLGDDEARAAQGPDDLANHLRSLPHHVVPEAIASLPGSIFGCALATGRGTELQALVMPALDVAEEMIWGTSDRRSLQWGRVAMAWVGIGRPDRAQACADEARNNVPGDLPRLEVPEQLMLAADLLEVSIRADPSGPAGPVETPPEVPSVDVGSVGGGIPDMGSREERELRELGPVVNSGAAVLIAGAGLPEARGAASAADILRGIVQRSEGASSLPTSLTSLMIGIDQGQLTQVRSALRAGRVPVEEMVLDAYAAPDDGFYAELARIPFSSVLTLAWDPQLLAAFAHRDPWVLHAGSSAVLDAAKAREFSFAWLAGDPSTEELAMGARDVRSRLYRDETLSRYLTSLLDVSPLLFLGSSASQVVEFFDTVLPFAPSSSSDAESAPLRFAVCPVDALWELSKAQLRDDYGVRLIGYPADVPESLPRVVRMLAEMSHDVPPGASSPSARTQPAMTRVRLENIGAFEDLELQLNETWNLLLGNNGCGKSTVLRAVALGLCGDHPQAVQEGATLLRAGTTRGSIELEVGPTRFRTELARSGDSVRVRTTSLTPLQQGNWAVLGFPALRGLSVGAASGISHSQAPEPRVEDLLPLLRGEVDHRMDDIKQWIINVAARAKDVDNQRSAGLLSRFFEVVKALTPGGTLEFERVDPEAWDVWVRTDDGIVSVDQLSQGMSSIIAWVGNLLQRMYDIYPDSPDPAREFAFVLIDELDAHLHPMWQRLVPSLTREHFPNVQFLATSHSPLIASSLRHGELFVARRVLSGQPDGSERLVATIRQEDLDPKGLRADQILTSPLFGMMTSRSPEHTRDVDRYSALMRAGSRTPEEESEIADLQKQLADSYRDGETATERDQEVAPRREDLREMLGKLDPGQIARVKDFVGGADGRLPSATEHGPPAEGSST